MNLGTLGRNISLITSSQKKGVLLIAVYIVRVLNNLIPQVLAGMLLFRAIPRWLIQFLSHIS